MRGRNAREEAGQATIEFALTLTFLLAAMFLVLQISLIYAYGNFAQYATFMAARTLLSAGAGTAADQDRRAIAALQALLKQDSGTDRWPGIASTKSLPEPESHPDLRGAEIWGSDSGQQGSYGINVQSADYSWMQGVRYRFRSRLFLLPIGQNTVGGKGKLELVSESWLGRDPEDKDCLAERKKRAQDLSARGLGVTEARLLLDNGC